MEQGFGLSFHNVGCRAVCCLKDGVPGVVVDVSSRAMRCATMAASWSEM